MVAHMNAEALRLTQETGIAHFWSRSRNSLWKKGETSGETLQVTEILTDCDQDVLLLKAVPQGKGAACHTGRRSCFYRRVEKDECSSSSTTPGCSTPRTFTNGLAAGWKARHRVGAFT